MTTPLPDYPVTFSLPVQWGDMDAFQHVNNTVYFRWFESARIAYFREAGVLAAMEATGAGPILRNTDCRFRIPLEYPDDLTVGARVTALGEDRFTMGYAVYSHGHGKLAAEGEGEIVWFDYRAKAKAPVHPDVVAKIRELEGDRLA